MAAAAQADPIQVPFCCPFLSLSSCLLLQSLFVTKIQEYAAKKKAAEGGMVDATPATQAELQVKNSHWDEDLTITTTCITIDLYRLSWTRLPRPMVAARAST